VKRPAGGFRGEIDVGRVPFGDVGNFFLGRRVEGRKRLAALGVAEFSIDQQLRLTHFGRAEFRFGSERGHWSSPEKNRSRRISPAELYQPRRGTSRICAKADFGFAICDFGCAWFISPIQNLKSK